MASKNRNDENTIYIQYCRSCDTHSWCTHHDEAKYHQTFLKFSEMMAHRMPEVEVIGNMVPSNLIPFKIAENKYIDASTNKYVVYPQIGSFEVTFRGRLIFSKKETHTWPNLPTIVSKISNIVNPDYQSPTKQEPPIEQDKQTSKVSNNNSFLDSQEQKKTNYKTQQKGFTLTDHFKMYRPKNTFQDKDWMTEKQESQASSRQISDMVRGQSRQKSDRKSDKSVETKKSSDIVGQTKLKQMLKHKGMITKDQGKKEMIIRLDSIEEQNIFQEAAAATHRTQQKNIKKNSRMREIDQQINALDNKFKDFQTRVHDIQARNKQFEMKPGSSNNEADKNRFKQIIDNKRDEMERNLSTKKSRQQEIKQARQKAFADKTNKLQQYLNYSQAEKNDKLHRIYGEWKLIKQFSNKNKKLLRGKEKGTIQQDNDDSDSQSASKNYSRSQSPNSYGNIITFKPKNEKMLERKMKNIKNQKQHKYSSVQRYHHASQLARDNKNQTDQHFYNNRKFFKPKPEIQSEADIHPSQPNPITKLIKKSVNTLSMNALKSLANNQSSNLPRIESEVNSVQNFSTSAKANINKINNRISNIQEKLKNHNNDKIQPIRQSPYADRERNFSKKSQSRSGSQHNNVSMKKLNKIYNGTNNNERHSNASGNTIKKNYSHQKIKNSNFSEVAKQPTKKANDRQAIDQDFQQPRPHQSKRKQAKYIDATEEDPVVIDTSMRSNSNSRLNKVNRNSRNVSKSKQTQIRQQKQTEGHTSKKFANIKPAKQTLSKQLTKQRRTQQTSSLNQEPEPRKAFKEKRSTQQMMQGQITADPKRAFRERKVQDHKERRQIQQQQACNYQQMNEEQQDLHQNEHQYEFHPHQARQAKPLQRKFKDWKQSSPTKNVLKSKQHEKNPKQGINQKIRQSDSKQTVVRSKKLKNNRLQQNQSIISSNGEDLHGKAYTEPVEEKKVRSGQIKRNRIPKKSANQDTNVVHHSSKQKNTTKKGQIRNQYSQPYPYNTERTQQNQDGEQSFNNDSQQIREPSNRFSSENQYQNNRNYEQSENSKQINDQKLRKTLGYFRANELCYRGVKTSENNRSGQAKVKQANQPSLYQTEHNNNDSQEQYVDHNAEEENHEENERDEEQSQSQDSQFVPQGKRKCEQAEDDKEQTEQGWKNKSDGYQNEDEMLPQETEEITIQKNERKNSLEQKLEKANEKQPQSKEENLNKEVNETKSQKIPNEGEFSKQEVARPQTTQEVCNVPDENINNQQVRAIVHQDIKEKAPLEKSSNQFQEKQVKQQQQIQNTGIKAQENVDNTPETANFAKVQTSKPKTHKNPSTKKQVKKQSTIDIELVVSKQYSQYLSSKISNNLSKIPEPTTVIACKPQEIAVNSNFVKENIQNKEENVQQNTSTPQQENEVKDFMSFEPAKVEQPIQDEEDQQQYQEDYEQEQPQGQKPQVEGQSPQQQNSQEPAIESSKPVQAVTVVNQSEVQQSTEKSQNQPQKIAEKSAQQEQSKTVVNTSIISPIESLPISIPKGQATQNLTPQSLAKVASAQPSSHNAQLPSQSPPSTKKDQPLTDNVYSETKNEVPARSKYAEMGVQKQLTLEVSIQTDSANNNDRIITARKVTVPSSEAQGKKSARSEIATPEQDNIFSEFDGTIRNNYLNDTKSSFRPDRSNKEPQRAKIINQIVSQNKERYIEMFSTVISGSDDYISKEEGAVTKLSSVYPQGIFMSQRSLEVEQIRTKFTKFSKALQILAERGEWILTRLFQDPKGLLQDRAFGIWLCLNFQWQCFVVDECIQVDQDNKPLFTIHTGNQKWVNVLEKALAKALGGYEQLSKTTCADFFTLLTGCNSINVKVKEDPSKNSKLLQLINQCQRKNYIVHAQKNWERSKEQKDSIYYVLSVRRSNSQEEALLEISQDGRESFWMRLSKFTQEFTRVEVLQLRVNHSFNHIDLGIGKDNQLTVVELSFNESGQGCVTLTYIDHIGPLTAYLYRQEKSRVLKLVGQAREKQKSHLFFECNFNEGRYYVFAQTKEKPARLAYYGQNSPSLRITEQILNDGLKNEVAEYLPIRQNKEKPRREMEQTWNDWKGKTPRLKDNFMQSRLRENFVEYILGQTKHKERGNEF